MTPVTRPPATGTRRRKVKCKHAPAPTGYLEWHAWADKKATTHRQRRCPGCGLWKVWVRK
jgi:hypothetical protein